MNLPNIVYTYEVIDDNLHIYTWVFKEFLSDDELLYYNRGLGISTILIISEDEEFDIHNDIFYERLDVLASVGDIIIEYKEGELSE